MAIRTAGYPTQGRRLVVATMKGLTNANPVSKDGSVPRCITTSLRQRDLEFRDVMTPLTEEDRMNQVLLREASKDPKTRPTDITMAREQRAIQERHAHKWL